MRFFFHLSNDISCMDEEGMELPDLATARAKGIESARSIMSAEIRNGKLPLADVITIANEKGTPMATVSFRETLEMSA